MICRPSDFRVISVEDPPKQTVNWLRLGDVAEVDYFHRVAASDPLDQLDVQVLLGRFASRPAPAGVSEQRPRRRVADRDGVGLFV